MTVSVGIDGGFAGTLVLADEVRAGRRQAARRSAPRSACIDLATGDRRDVAEAVGSGLSLDRDSFGAPDEKVAVVQEEGAPTRHDDRRRRQRRAGARGGRSWRALGASGAAASAEAADVVRSSIVSTGCLTPCAWRAGPVGSLFRASMPASVSRSWGWLPAALGYLTPVQGALMQEAIDVAVILNALRALRGEVTRRDVENLAPASHERRRSLTASPATVRSGAPEFLPIVAIAVRSGDRASRGDA